MHKDRDFAPNRELPGHHKDLTQDLELQRLFDAMAQGDRFLADVARNGVFASLGDPEDVAYRQHVLRDCQDQPSVIRELYAWPSRPSRVSERCSAQRIGDIPKRFCRVRSRCCSCSWGCSRGCGFLPTSTRRSFGRKGL